jgi:polo-like kinase 1
MVGSSNNFVSTQANYFKEGTTKAFSSYRSELKGLQSMKSLPSGAPSNFGNSTGSNFTKTKTVLNNFNNLRGNEIWVKKWVDYSAKYGLGYLLSNGCTGVHFNDSTKIVMDVKGQYFEYFEKKGNEGQDAVSSYSFLNYPANLQKKVTLLQHFKSYLEGENKLKYNVN